MNSIRNRQLPGRQEALRLAMGDPTASPLLRHIAGLDKQPQRQPACATPETFQFSSGVDELTPAERSALPF